MDVQLPPNSVTWVSPDRSLIVSVTIDQLREAIGFEAFDAGLVRAVNERLVVQLGAVTDEQTEPGPESVREALTSPLATMGGEAIPMPPRSAERP